MSNYCDHLLKHYDYLNSVIHVCIGLEENISSTAKEQPEEKTIDGVTTDGMTTTTKGDDQPSCLITSSSSFYLLNNTECNCNNISSR